MVYSPVFRGLHFLLLKSWNFVHVNLDVYTITSSISVTTILISKTFLHIFFKYSKDKTIVYAVKIKKKKEINFMYTALKNRENSIPSCFLFYFSTGNPPWIFFLQICKATTNQDLILDSSPPSLFGDGQQRFVYRKHC